MKIGDKVAIQVSKTRTLVFGVLANVDRWEATVDVGGRLYRRALKRVRTNQSALTEIIRRRNARAKKAARGGK